MGDKNMKIETKREGGPEFHLSAPLSKLLGQLCMGSLWINVFLLLPIFLFLGSGKDFGGRHLRVWEEAIGILKNITLAEGHILASIGLTTVILPREMAPRLSELMNSRIGIIRCDDGYRVRSISEAR
jgi:hypothetical protein